MCACEIMKARQLKDTLVALLNVGFCIFFFLLPVPTGKTSRELRKTKKKGDDNHERVEV